MILNNPTNGAPIKRDYKGNVWMLNVGQQLQFEDEVGKFLIEIYPFLEEVEANISVKAEIIQDGEVFKCSACEYNNKEKIGVVSHIRFKHPVVEGAAEVQKAIPVGTVKRNPTIYEARAMAHSMGNPLDPEIPNTGAKDNDGVEWYGEGFREERPASRNIGGVAGRFGAAS